VRRSERCAWCAAARSRRSQTTNQRKALLVTAPAELREQLRTLSATALIATCARLRPAGDIADPEHATKTALRRLARRHQFLSQQISDADAELRTLVTAAAARLIALPGVGTQVAGELLTTAGDNPDRLHPQAAFAHLFGVAPSLPAAVGPNDTGSTAAVTEPPNNALYVVVLGRCRSPRSSAVSSATSHASSTTPCNPSTSGKILPGRLVSP